MAVIPGLEGIEVRIEVNSTQIKERLRKSGPNFVTTYISPAPNTEFEVILSITSECQVDCPTLGFDIFVDGIKLASKCCLQSKRGCSKEWFLRVQGAEMGRLDAGYGVVRPFIFSNVGIGTIRVEVHRRDDGQLVDMGCVPEPEAVGFKLGHPRPMHEPVTFWYAPLLDSKPVGVFKFIYILEDEMRHSPEANGLSFPEKDFPSSPPRVLKQECKEDRKDEEHKGADFALVEQDTNQRRNFASRRIKREHSDDNYIIPPTKKVKKSAPDERTKAVFNWNGSEVVWSSVPWFDSDDEESPMPVIKRECEATEGNDENLPRKRRRLYDGGDEDYPMDY